MYVDRGVVAYRHGICYLGIATSPIFTQLQLPSNGLGMLYLFYDASFPAPLSVTIQIAEESPALEDGNHAWPFGHCVHVHHSLLHNLQTAKLPNTILPAPLAGRPMARSNTLEDCCAYNR